MSISITNVESTGGKARVSGALPMTSLKAEEALSHDHFMQTNIPMKKRESTSQAF